MTRRTTQLRATFDLGAGHMRAIWLVLSPAPLADLVDDVTDELATVVVEHGLRVTDARWVCLYGEHGVWLRADLTVQPWAPEPTAP